MKKTVLIADKNGQLGNQLFIFAHFISNSIENNYRLIFPAFNELSVYFDYASKNRFGKYPIRCRIFKWSLLNNISLFILRMIVAVIFRTVPVSKFHRIIRLYETFDLHIDNYAFYNLDKEEKFLKKEKFLIMQGWSFRSPESVNRQRNNVRPLFQLVPYWRKKVDDFISECRIKNDVLIGVHIRRGDYRTFTGGIYFYDDATYKNYIQQVKALFPGKKVRFVICSNEKVDLWEIEGCDLTYPYGHFIEDLYSLAECDYIIGPPSTFSQWASYFGNKPLRIIWNADSTILSLDEFKIANL